MKIIHISPHYQRHPQPRPPPITHKPTKNQSICFNNSHLSLPQPKETSPPSPQSSSLPQPQIKKIYIRQKPTRKIKSLPHHPITKSRKASPPQNNQQKISLFRDYRQTRSGSAPKVTIYFPNHTLCPVLGFLGRTLRKDIGIEGDR